MKPIVAVVLTAVATGWHAGGLAQPADADACAACHGADGVSVAAGTPHLAAQDPQYLAATLAAYRDGRREHTLMNAIAARLDDDGIEALASFFAGLPGPSDGQARSELAAALRTDDFPFPADYASEFTRYRTSTPGNEVRHFYANDVAMDAAREGRPLPDGAYLLVAVHARAVDDDGEAVRDGNGEPVAGRLTGFNVMAREAGWGQAVPELLRNENWLYTTFAPDGTVNAETHQAPCLACHVPLSDQSYVFSIEALTEAAGGQR